MKRIVSLILLMAATAAHAGLDAIRTLQPTQGQEVRHAIESQVFGASMDQLPALEAELLEIFADPATTLEGKQYSCRMLRFCASDAAVPVLEKELLNPELSHFTRFALQGIDAPAVDTALLAALPEASDALKIGIVGTLGQRETATAVKAIAPYLESDDPALQLATIKALGNIGGREAAQALLGIDVETNYQREWDLATIQATHGLGPGFLGLKHSTCNKVICKSLLNSPDVEVRCAALTSFAKGAPKKAAPLVLEQLHSENQRERATALGLLSALRTKELTVALADSEHAVLILHELARRKAMDAEGVVLSKLNDADADVSEAAWTALGDVGGAAALPILIGAAPTNKVAYASLARLDYTATDSELLIALQATDDDAVKTTLIELAAERQSDGALPIFVALAAGEWSRPTAAAIIGLADVVHEADIVSYMELMAATDSAKKIKALEKSLAVAAQYQSNSESVAEVVAAAYPKAEGEMKYALIRAMGSIGGPVAERILNEARESEDPKAKDAAIRGLCASPSLSVAPELLKLAESSENNTHKVLALRGYIRLANAVNDPTEKVAMCAKAAALTDRTAELKSIIACAKNAKSKEAIELIAPMIDQPELLTDCGWALIECSWNWKVRTDTLEPLKKVVELTDDKDLKFYASDRVKAIESQ